jgi:hypothetical protein
MFKITDSFRIAYRTCIMYRHRLYWKMCPAVARFASNWQLSCWGRHQGAGLKLFLPKHISVAGRHITHSSAVFKICVVFRYDIHGIRSRDSSVGIATGYGVDGRGVGVLVPSRVKNFLHVVQTVFGAHPASYAVGTGGSFPGGKAAGTWSWLLTFN